MILTRYLRNSPYVCHIEHRIPNHLGKQHFSMFIDHFLEVIGIERVFEFCLDAKFRQDRIKHGIGAAI